MNTTERTTLYYREGSSDKVYQASIEPAGNLFVVNFAFGRRGSTLNTGTKTNTPVAYSSARTIYDKVVREKKAKGYTEGEAGIPYENASGSNEHSGISPQLLNPVGEDEVEALLNSSNWCMQEKFDGKRLLIKKAGSTILGINRRGLIIGLPKTISDELANTQADFILDGEAVGERYFVFDLLNVGSDDLRTAPYRSRLADLVRLIGFGTFTHVQTVPSFITPEQKHAFFHNVVRQKKEGVVFKQLEAAYTSGRPVSGGSQLKYKFVATLSAQVTQVNNGRSVALSLLGAAGWGSTPSKCAMPSRRWSSAPTDDAWLLLPCEWMRSLQHLHRKLRKRLSRKQTKINKQSTVKLPLRPKLHCNLGRRLKGKQ